MANLILWRHAEAEIMPLNGKDIDRALTKGGRKDAAKMAKWLNQHLPKNTEILCSPARRCLETAATLNDESNYKNLHAMRYEIKQAKFLGVDSTVEAMAEQVVNDDSSKTILLIGHQPNLGQLIAKLLGMDETTCVVKKGSVWWLRQRFVNGASQTYLFTVQQPDY